MIEPYNYNDEPSGRSETLVQALERCERLEKENNDLKNEIKSLYDREEILVRKLNIALDCVLSYSDRKEWKSTENGESCYFGNDGYELAEEALDKIKEVGMIKEVKFEPFSSRLLKQKITDCNLLKKQLDVAIKALEIYADKTNWDNHFIIEINNCEIEVITFIEGTDKDGEFYAEKALQQIKELEK